MNNARTSRDISSVVKAIPLEIVAERMGYTPVRVGNEISLKEHESVGINPDSNLFCRRSMPIGDNKYAGGSSIDFVMMFGNNESGMSKREAYSFLRGMIGLSDVQQAFDQRTNERREKPKPTFSPPEKDGSKSKRLWGYLHGRGIDNQVIQNLVKRKQLYTDSHGNACFLGSDYDGNIKYGFVRSTLTLPSSQQSDSEPIKRFRCMDMIGSNKDVGFSINLVNPEGEPRTKLLVTESVIDALSMQTLFVLHGMPEQNYAYLSLGGTSPRALMYHVEHNPQLQQIYLCQDNDAAGNESREQCRTALRVAGYAGAIIDKIPIRKDWNDDLKQRRYELSRSNPQPNNQPKMEVTR